MCRAGAKCFLAYSRGIFGSTMARKSRSHSGISDQHSLSVFITGTGSSLTFSNVGGFEFPREVQEVLNLVAKVSPKHSQHRFSNMCVEGRCCVIKIFKWKRDTTYFRHGYHTKPAAPPAATPAAVKYLVAES